jgi:PTS system glucose-specific IIC component
MGNAVQVVFGPVSENLKTDMQSYLKSPVPAVPTDQALLRALGGAGNVRSARAVAGTRLRVVLVDAARFDAEGARQAGVRAVMPVAPGVMHLIVGPRAPEMARDLPAA